MLHGPPPLPPIFKTMFSSKKMNIAYMKVLVLSGWKLKKNDLYKEKKILCGIKNLIIAILHYI